MKTMNGHTPKNSKKKPRKSRDALIFLLHEYTKLHNIVTLCMHIIDTSYKNKQQSRI